MWSDSCSTHTVSLREDMPGPVYPADSEGTSCHHTWDMIEAQGPSDVEPEQYLGLHRMHSW